MLKKYPQIFWIVLLVALYVAATHLPTHAPAPADASLTGITHTINRMAQEGADIRLSKHARERMEQRGFTLEDIRTTLANGTVKTPPREGKYGDLSYKLEDVDTRGTKDGEVVVVLKDDALFIITVMWDGKD